MLRIQAEDYLSSHFQIRRQFSNNKKEAQQFCCSACSVLPFRSALTEVLSLKLIWDVVVTKISGTISTGVVQGFGQSFGSSIIKTSLIFLISPTKSWNI